jgi:hypothetical protein
MPTAAHYGMKPFIKIVRHPYEEPHHVHLVVEASNERQHGQMEIYANAKDLTMVAERVRSAPRAENDVALWELGSERPEDRFGFFFRLRAFRLSPTGRCAIELRYCNNRTPPERESIEFSIEAMPADLDRLATLLDRFGELRHRVLEWTLEAGELRESD